MRRTLPFGLMLASLAITYTGRAGAQVTSSSLVKGQLYTVMVPAAVFTGWAAPSVWDGRINLTAEVSSGDEIKWQASGFPSMLPVKFEKVNAKKEFTDVEFAGTGSGAARANVTLRFRPGFDYKIVIGRMIVLGTPSSAAVQAALDEAYKILADKFFTGPLATLPAEKQRILVAYAHVTANGTNLKSETYKNNLYMVVDLGRDTTVYNDLRFTQSTLLAHVMNDRLLTILKAFAKPVEGAPQLYGLKLEYQIPHRSFLDQTGLAVNDVLQLYAPADLIKKFADADITNQQFVDGCVAIVNENRVQVSLAAPSGN